MKIGKNIEPKPTATILNRSLADKMWKTVTTSVHFNARQGMNRPMRMIRDLMGITFDL